MKAQTKIALRINDDNPNHHLWNDIEKARARRDKIFASIQQHFGIAA